jgi:pimeloyl-ACP methyl ester carboxylesterase
VFLHNKWPGSDTLDDDVWRQFAASVSPMMASSAEAEQLAADGLVELLERIGPAVLLGHSLGVPSVYRAADMRPDLVCGLVAVEGVGPQFLNHPDLGIALRWGVTSTPVAYDPPAAEPQDLDLTVDGSGPVQLTLQREPARRLANLSRVPIALVSAEGSAFRWFGGHVQRFLEQAGCTVDHVQLWEHGVRGNGHAMMLESNNEDSLVVVVDWIARRTRPGGRGR